MECECDGVRIDLIRLESAFRKDRGGSGNHQMMDCRSSKNKPALRKTAHIEGYTSVPSTICRYSSTDFGSTYCEALCSTLLDSLLRRLLNRSMSRSEYGTEGMNALRQQNITGTNFSSALSTGD
ncbi:hypothetical protein KL929_002264 [Ogataea haglerorum]|nr:hypothetical protein KL929_002264 [Ogataea haglerorum]